MTVVTPTLQDWARLAEMWPAGTTQMAIANELDVTPQRLGQIARDLGLQRHDAVSGAIDSLADKLGVSRAGLDREIKRLAGGASVDVEGSTFPTGGGGRIDWRRLDIAFDRIGHQSSPTFRRRLATAYNRSSERVSR
jgi:hypothetical protein